MFDDFSENVAYGRTTMQKEGSSSVNSSYAVDDSIHTCSASKSNVPGWWALTLDHVISVRSIILKAGKAYIYINSGISNNTVQSY